MAVFIFFKHIQHVLCTFFLNELLLVVRSARESDVVEVRLSFAASHLDFVVATIGILFVEFIVSFHALQKRWDFVPFPNVFMIFWWGWDFVLAGFDCNRTFLVILIFC
jgi:hypothetical protein